MSYINKYEANKKWANLAYDEQEYDIATNRYYYSIFQKILHQIHSNNLTVHLDGQHNSHNYTISAYVRELLEGNNPRDTFRIRMDFNSRIMDLKQLRHCADYEAGQLTQEEAKLARGYFEELDMKV